MRWNNIGEKIESFSSFKRFAMMWDYPEVNLFASGSGNAADNVAWVADAMQECASVALPARCERGDAVAPPIPDGRLDAVLTDPPYYDNESYAELSDMFYIWQRFMLHDVHCDHFSSPLTPKKRMIVAAAYLHGGTAESGAEFYENSLADALRAARAKLKDSGSLILVYAHKTTLGWSTLVSAIRAAGFTMEEAWPLDTEEHYARAAWRPCIRTALIRSFP